MEDKLRLILKNGPLQPNIPILLTYCLSSGSSTYVPMIKFSKGTNTYIHSRDRSKFWSKMKTSKSQGLLLSCTKINSSSWQINAVKIFRFVTLNSNTNGYLVVQVCPLGDDQRRVPRCRWAGPGGRRELLMESAT